MPHFSTGYDKSFTELSENIKFINIERFHDPPVSYVKLYFERFFGKVEVWKVYTDTQKVGSRKVIKALESFDHSSIGSPMLCLLFFRITWPS